MSFVFISFYLIPGRNLGGLHILKKKKYRVTCDKIVIKKPNRIEKQV